MGGVEAVEPDLDALAHHRLENRQPLRIAHAAAVGAVGAALDDTPSERSVRIALQGLPGSRARRRPQQIVRPCLRPLPAEQTESLLVIAEIHGRRQLAGDAGTRLPYPGNDLGRHVEVGPRTGQGHPRPRGWDILVPGQGIEVRSEVPHLHQLYSRPAYVIDDLRRSGQGPVFDHAADAAVFVHVGDACLSPYWRSGFVVTLSKSAAPLSVPLHSKQGPFFGERSGIARAWRRKPASVIER